MGEVEPHTLHTYFFGVPMHGIGRELMCAIVHREVILADAKKKKKKKKPKKKKKKKSPH